MQWRRLTARRQVLARGPLEVTIDDLVSVLRLVRSRRRSDVRPPGSGDRVARAVATGTEFDRLRPFAPGDDARRVDWRVSLTTGDLHVRVFEPVGRQPLLIVLDCSASMREPAAAAAKGMATPHWLGCRLSVAAACLAVMHGDKATLVAQGAPGDAMALPVRSISDARDGMRGLDAFRPSGQCGLADMPGLIRRFARDRGPGLLLVVSDFLGLGEPGLAMLRGIAARGNPVAALHIDSHAVELALLAGAGDDAELVDSEDSGRLDVALDAALLDRYRRAADALHANVRAALVGPTSRVFRCDTGRLRTGQDLIRWTTWVFDEMGLL